MEQTIDDNRAHNGMSEEAQLSPDALAAYLDGRLEGQELDRVEAHLADNPSARQELINASRIIAAAPQRHRRRSYWIPLAGLAAAAAIAIVAGLPKMSLRDPASVSSERRGATEAYDRVVLLNPQNGQRVELSPLSLSWRSIDGASYRVVVSDATGKTLLQQNTYDTLVSIPDSVLASGNGTYYWTVDALAPDGSSMTSGASEFIVGNR